MSATPAAWRRFVRSSEAARDRPHAPGDRRRPARLAVHPAAVRVPAQRGRAHRAQLGRDRRRPRHRVAAQRDGRRGVARRDRDRRARSRLEQAADRSGDRASAGARRGARPQRARPERARRRRRRGDRPDLEVAAARCSATRRWAPRSRRSPQLARRPIRLCSPAPRPATTRSTTTSRSSAPPGARRAASTSRSSTSAARSSSPTHIRRARVVIGTSLHVRIVAAAYGVPRVSLAKPKPTRYARLWDPDMPFDVALEDLDAAVEAASRGRRGPTPPSTRRASRAPPTRTSRPRAARPGSAGPRGRGPAPGRPPRVQLEALAASSRRSRTRSRHCGATSSDGPAGVA